MHQPTTEQPAHAHPDGPTVTEASPTASPSSTTRDLRRANRRLLAGLALFAVTLAAVCFLWMYGRMAGQREAERAAAESASRQTEPAAPANPSPSPVAPR